MTDAKAPAASVHHVDEAWLAKRREDVIDPTLPIIDPHHHFWKREVNYVLEELLADIDTGHNIVSTVFVECGAQYRKSGSEEMAPLGETEFVMDIVDQVAREGVKIDVAAGIVGYADLRLGAKVREVLEAQVVAGRGRFRGIRNMSTYDADPGVPRAPTRLPGRDFLGTKAVREGAAQLGPLGLSFDAWVLHPQIPELSDFADAIPDTTIVLNHIGGRIGTGHYADDLKAAFADWRKNMIELGKRPNVYIKVGGMGMSVFGFNFQSKPLPPSSEEMATAWRPLVETCIEAFGPARCMFQSNFPADKAYSSYAIIWNAFKRITQGASASEKAALFHDTAAKAYRLQR